MTENRSGGRNEIVTAIPKIIDGIINAVLNAIPQIMQAGIELPIPLIQALATDFDVSGSFRSAVDGVTGNPRLTVTNSNVFDSKPYIKIYGSGMVRIMITPSGKGATTWLLSDVNEYIETDSKHMNCFKDAVLKNTVTGESLPVLQPGENSIACTGNAERVEVIPR